MMPIGTATTMAIAGINRVPRGQGTRRSARARDLVGADGDLRAPAEPEQELGHRHRAEERSDSNTSESTMPAS